MEPIREVVLSDRPHAVRVPFKLKHTSNGACVGIAPRGSAINLALLKTKTAFGVGATISLGTQADPTALINAADVAAVGVDQSPAMLVEFDVDTPIYATIAGGPTAGEALGFLEFTLEMNKAY